MTIDIVKLAREAASGEPISYHLENSLTRRAWTPWMQNFANAIIEECAKKFDGEVWAYDYREIAAAIREMKK